MSTQPSRYPYALDRETLVVCGVVFLGAVMSIVDMTVVNVALDRLCTEFRASFTTIQWVVSAYSLALAAVVPATGWASDRFGEKRIYIAAVTAFTIGSALCAAAWSAPSLIVFRVLQGLGGGMVLPVVMTIVTKKAGPHRRGRVSGLLGIPLLAVPVLGPILGGWLVDVVSWRAIFLINVPIGALAVALAQVILKGEEPQRGDRLDWLGLGLLSPGLALLIFGLAESPAHGFGPARVWLPILVGVVLIIMFLFHSWRSPAPLIDVKTFVHTRAGAAALTLLLLTTSLFGALLLMPVYLQVARGTSAFESGLLLAPQGLGAMITMPIAGWLTDRYGPSWLPICSVPVLAAGFAPFALVTDSTPFILLSAANLLIGLGMGLSYSPTITAAMLAVPERAIARTSTAMSVIDQSGASIGAAVLSVLLVGAIAAAVPGTAGGGLDAVENMARAHRDALAGPLAEAFASTFVWALVAVIATGIPALALALGKKGEAAELKGGAEAVAEHT